MASRSREKLTTRVRSEILSAPRDLAKSEGRQLQTLVDEALADLIEKRKRGTLRASIMAVYQASHEKFAPLYKKLGE